MQRKDRADNASKGCSGKYVRYLSQVVTRPRLHAGCTRRAPTLHPHCNLSHLKCTSAAICEILPHRCILQFQCSRENLQLAIIFRKYVIWPTSLWCHIYCIFCVTIQKYNVEQLQNCMFQWPTCNYHRW